jgi:hypothetical protein
MVSKVDNTSLQIQAGLGVNHQGQVIHLPSDTTLQLVIQPTNNTPVDDAGRFKDCDFSSTGGGTGVITDGAYLLTAIPASRLDGLVPLKAAAGSTTPPGCAAKWEVEGLQFKAIRLSGFEAETKNITDNNRRNLLAHWCYGSQHLPDLARDPFHFNSNFGGLDKVDPADLTPCDLSLAVFYWLNGALLFVDDWSARRRLIRPDALDETQETVVPGGFGFFPLIERFALAGTQIAIPRPTPPIGPIRIGSIFQQKTRTWKGILSDKRVAEGQARFLQFQAQLDSLIAEGKASRVDAHGYFPLMPPAGFLPVSLVSLEETVRRELSLSSAPWQVAEAITERVALARSQPTSPPAAAGQPTFEHITTTVARPASVIAASVARSFATGVSLSPELLALSNHAQLMSDQVQQLQNQIDTLTKQVKELEARGGASRTPKASKSASKKLQRRERTFLQELVALMQPRMGLGFAGNRINGGFNLVQFFDNLPIHVGLIDRETVDFLIQRSWYDEAVDLSSASQLTHNIDEGIIVGGGTTGRSSRRNVVAPLFEVYVVLENLISTSDQLYVLFTKVVRPTTWLHPFEKIRG